MARVSERLLVMIGFLPLLLLAREYQEESFDLHRGVSDTGVLSEMQEASVPGQEWLHTPVALRIARAQALAQHELALSRNLSEVGQAWLGIADRARLLSNDADVGARQAKSIQLWKHARRLRRADGDTTTPATEFRTTSQDSVGVRQAQAALRGQFADSKGSTSLAAVSPTPAPVADTCKPPDVFADPVGTFLLTDNTGRNTFDLGNFDRCVNREYRATLNVTMQTAYCVLEVQGVTFGSCMPVACGSTRAIRRLSNGLWALWLVETIPTLLIITQEAEGVTASCVTGPSRGIHAEERQAWARAAMAGMAACLLLSLAGTVAVSARAISSRASEAVLRGRMRRLQSAIGTLVSRIGSRRVAGEASAGRGLAAGATAPGGAGLRIRAPAVVIPGGDRSGASDSADSTAGLGIAGPSLSGRAAEEALVLSAIGLRAAKREARELAAAAASAAACEFLLSAGLVEGGEELPALARLQSGPQGGVAGSSKSSDGYDPSSLTTACHAAKQAWRGATARMLPHEAAVPAAVPGDAMTATPGAAEGGESSALLPPEGPRAGSGYNAQYLCGLAASDRFCGPCNLLMQAFSCQHAGRLAGCGDCGLAAGTVLPGSATDAADIKIGGRSSRLMGSLWPPGTDWTNGSLWNWSGHDRELESESPLVRPLLCLRGLSMLGFTVGVSLQAARQVGLANAVSLSSLLASPGMQPLLAAADFGTEGMLTASAALAAISALEALRRGTSHWQLSACICSRKVVQVWILAAVAAAWIGFVLPSIAPIGPNWKMWNMHAATCMLWGLPGLAGLSNLMPVFGRASHQCIPYAGSYAAVEMQLVALAVPLALVLPALGGRRVAMLVLVLLLITSMVVNGAIVTTHDMRLGPTVAWGEGPGGEGHDGSGMSSQYARLFAWAPWTRLPSVLIAMLGAALWDVGVDGRWAWRVRGRIEASRAARGMTQLVVGGSTNGDEFGAHSPVAAKTPVPSGGEGRPPSGRGGSDSWMGWGAGSAVRHSSGYAPLREQSADNGATVLERSRRWSASRKTPEQAQQLASECDVAWDLALFGLMCCNCRTTSWAGSCIQDSDGEHWAACSCFAGKPGGMRSKSAGCCGQLLCMTSDGHISATRSHSLSSESSQQSEDLLVSLLPRDGEVGDGVTQMARSGTMRPESSQGARLVNASDSDSQQEAAIDSINAGGQSRSAADIRNQKLLRLRSRATRHGSKLGAILRRTGVALADIGVGDVDRPSSDCDSNWVPHGRCCCCFGAPVPAPLPQRRSSSAPAPMLSRLWGTALMFLGVALLVGTAVLGRPRQAPGSVFGGWRPRPGHPWGDDDAPPPYDDADDQWVDQAHVDPDAKLAGNGALGSTESVSPTSHYLSKTWSSKHARLLYITLSRPAWGLGGLLVCFGLALGGGGALAAVARWRVWGVFGRLALPILFVFPIVSMAATYDETQYVRVTLLLQARRWLGSLAWSFLGAWIVFATVGVPVSGLWSLLAVGLGCAEWTSGESTAESEAQSDVRNASSLGGTVGNADARHGSGPGARVEVVGRMRSGGSSSQEDRSRGSNPNDSEHSREHTDGSLDSRNRYGPADAAGARVVGAGGAEPIGIATRPRGGRPPLASGGGGGGALGSRTDVVNSGDRRETRSSGYGSGVGTELAPPSSGGSKQQQRGGAVPHRRESADPSLQRGVAAADSTDASEYDDNGRVGLLDQAPGGGASPGGPLSSSAPQPSHAALRSGTHGSTPPSGSPGAADVAWRAARRWRRDRLAALAHVAQRNDSFGVVDEEDDEGEDGEGEGGAGGAGGREGSKDSSQEVALDLALGSMGGGDGAAWGEDVAGGGGLPDGAGRGLDGLGGEGGREGQSADRAVRGQEPGTAAAGLGDGREPRRRVRSAAGGAAAAAAGGVVGSGGHGSDSGTGARGAPSLRAPRRRRSRHAGQAGGYLSGSGEELSDTGGEGGEAVHMGLGGWRAGDGYVSAGGGSSAGEGDGTVRIPGIGSDTD